MVKLPVYEIMYVRTCVLTYILLIDYICVATIAILQILCCRLSKDPSLVFTRTVRIYVRIRTQHVHSWTVLYGLD